MKRTTRWFWAVVAAQAVFLLAWAGWHERVRQESPVVRLKTRPVDPQDLLRGDYMVLRYEISEVKPVVAGDGRGRDYWVVLEPRESYHAAVAATLEKPALKAGQIAVRGTWSYGSRDDMVYGIETFFVPEGKGTPRFKTIEVEASVAPDDRLYIRRVLVDGKTYP